MQRRTATLLVTLITLAGAALRVWVATRGGYYFSIDEPQRFHPALVAVDAVLAGHGSEVCAQYAMQLNHVGFHLLATPVAFLGRALFGVPTHETMPWYTALLALTAGTWFPPLAYRVARRFGAGRGEGVVAAGFTAGAVSLTYFSRHLLSYDSSLALALLALWLGGSGKRSGLVGAVAMQAWLTYYGYLWPAALGCVANFLRAPRRAHAAITGALGGALVFGAYEAVVATCAPGTIHGWEVPPFHIGLWRQLQTNNQDWGSSYAEGWRIPFLYLSETEGILALVWLGLGSFAAARGVRRAQLWLGVVLAFYVLLVTQSTLLERTVVVGRFVRCLIPYLILAGAAGAATLAADRPVRSAALTALFVWLAAANFRPVVTMRFPADVFVEWRGYHPEIEMASTLVGSDPPPEPLTPDARHVAVNVEASYPWPVEGSRALLPGRILASYPHPLAWGGYRYEGFREHGRAALVDLRMWLIEREATNPEPR